MTGELSIGAALDVEFAMVKVIFSSWPVVVERPLYKNSSLVVVLSFQSELCSTCFLGLRAKFPAVTLRNRAPAANGLDESSQHVAEDGGRREDSRLAAVN